MTTALLGGLLGLALALGVLVAIRSAPPLRPVRLVDRMAPYLPDAPAPSKLLAAPARVRRRSWWPAGCSARLWARSPAGSTGRWAARRPYAGD